MNKKGPIIFIDDDTDDLELYKYTMKSLNLKNDILLFSSAENFLDYLRLTAEKFFFILCDVNMPLINGFELRSKMTQDASLAYIGTPFLFFSTSSSAQNICAAYREPIQGYFVKPSNIDDMKRMFKNIIAYWNDSEHPTGLTA